MRRGLTFLVFACAAVVCQIGSAGVNDTYFENFDSRLNNVTIGSVDSWQVVQGAAANAVVQNTVTLTGRGNALRLTGNETVVKVSRPKLLGSVAPCWVEFYVKPGIGGEIANVPSGKAAAVTFDYTGKVYAADGSSWHDTGSIFTAGQWYRVLLKLDFSTHLYDVYINHADTTQTEFVPVSEDMRFIDSSISSLSDLGFEGVYNSVRDDDDDTYIDSLLVNFVNKITIITTSQSLSKKEVSGPITIQLQNSVSTPQTAWEDITLRLSSDSEMGEFSLDKQAWVSIGEIVVTEGNFQAEFYYKDEKEGQPIISVKEYPDRGWEDALQQQEITSGAASFGITVNTPQTAGEYFQMTITAKSEDGETDETYSGTVEIAAQYVNPQTGLMNIVPDEVSGFENGVLEVEANYPDCGTIKIKVSDTEDSDKTGFSGEVLFVPASLGVTCGSTQIVNASFDAEIVAYNARGIVTPNYRGPCVLTAVPVLSADTSDGQIVPGLVSENDFSGGIARINAFYDRWGLILIEASDTNNPSRNGTSGNVMFYPKDVLLEITPPEGDRTFFYTGESFDVVISLVDDNGELIPNYASSIVLNPDSGLKIENTYQFIPADGGKHTFFAVCDAPGSYRISVNEPSSGKSVQSEKIKVKQATLTVISTEAAVGTIAEVFVTLTDEENNVITTENNLTINITFEEENPNGTAESSTERVPVTFRKGVAKFTITNPEAEIVTVIPKSEYGFKIKRGTVKFGRVAKFGIGTLMWREVK
ncbi:MAG: hypothetical protein ABH844_05925 [Candidatus Omnitrophota bacterium]